MPEQFRLNCSATVNKLQQDVRNTEALFVEVAQIVKDGNGTVLVGEQVNEAPSPIFILLDPTGTATKPGHSLVCRGTACIGGQTQKVAAFRAASDSLPAGTPPPPAGGSGSPPPPSPSPPEPDEEEPNDSEEPEEQGPDEEEPGAGR